MQAPSRRSRLHTKPERPAKILDRTLQLTFLKFLLGQFGNEDPVFAADNIPFVATGYDNAYKFYQAQKPVLLEEINLLLG